MGQGDLGQGSQRLISNGEGCHQSWGVMGGNKGAKNQERFWNNPQGIVLSPTQGQSGQSPTERRQLGRQQTPSLAYRLHLCPRQCWWLKLTWRLSAMLTTRCPNMAKRAPIKFSCKESSQGQIWAGSKLRGSPEIFETQLFAVPKQNQKHIHHKAIPQTLYWNFTT